MVEFAFQKLNTPRVLIAALCCDKFSIVAVSTVGKGSPTTDISVNTFSFNTFRFKFSWMVVTLAASLAVTISPLAYTRPTVSFRTVGHTWTDMSPSPMGNTVPGLVAIFFISSINLTFVTKFSS